MTDLISRKQRLGGYKPFKLRLAIFLTVLGFAFFAGTLIVTALTNNATSQVEFRNAHAFKPVH